MDDIYIPLSLEIPKEVEIKRDKKPSKKRKRK